LTCSVDWKLYRRVEEIGGTARQTATDSRADGDRQ
jgi:hypothetical protein